MGTQLRGFIFCLMSNSRINEQKDWCVSWKKCLWYQWLKCRTSVWITDCPDLGLSCLLVLKWIFYFSSLSEKESSQDTNRLLHWSSACCVPFDGLFFLTPSLQLFRYFYVKEGCGRERFCLLYFSISPLCAAPVTDLDYLWRFNSFPLLT